MVVSHQQILYRIRLFPRFLNAACQLILTQHTVSNQTVIGIGFFAWKTVAGLTACIKQLLHTLANGNAQCLAQLLRTVFFKLAEGLVATVVDHLQHTKQIVTGHYGGH